MRKSLEVIMCVTLGICAAEVKRPKVTMLEGVCVQ